MTNPEQGFSLQGGQLPKSFLGEELRSLLESVVQALWETDPTGQVHLDSPSWRAYTGQSYQQWLSDGWVGGVHPDEQAVARHQWQQALGQHTALNANFRLHVPHGGWRWTQVRIHPIVEVSGQPRKWVGMAMDISEQKQTETKLKHSLAQLHLATDAAQAGWGTWDFKTGASNWDERGKQIIGFADPAESETAQGWLQRVHPDDLEQVNQHIAQCLAQNRDFGLDYRVIRADGQTRLIRASGRFAKAPDGTPLTGTGLVVDITQTAQTEVALRENEERQAFLLRISDALRPLVDPLAIQQAVTQTTRAYFRADRCYYCEVKAGNALIHQESRRADLPSVLGVYPLSQFPFFKRLVDEGQPLVVANVSTSTRIDEELIRQCIPLQVISFIALPIIKTGQAVGILFIAQSTPRDWTELEVGLVQETAERTWAAVERAHAEDALRQSEERYRQLAADLETRIQERTQQLQEANQELKRSNEHLQEFAYVASHDLQEPLRKIQQFGDLLKTHLGDALGEETIYLDRMQTAAGRMSTLIKDLLNYSRITTKRDTNRLVVLREVVDQVLATLELPIQETGAQILIGSLPTVQGDASQLRQLFQNLLSNALKFSRVDNQGALMIPQISITAQRVNVQDLPPSVKPLRMAPAYQQIMVADNGVGFEEKYLDRIFQVFQRLHGKGQYGGTGIGLAICQKVVFSHGGAITASSQPGQGARFSIYMPE